MKRNQKTQTFFHWIMAIVFILGASLPSGTLAGGVSAPSAAPVEDPDALTCESFDGFVAGSTISTYTGWYSNPGPVVTAGNGVGGSTGLGSAGSIFNWTAHPFNWNASDFEKIILQNDFETDGSGSFDDDRLSWTINGTSDSSSNQFGVQLDHLNGGIVTYWSNVIGGAKINDVIVPLTAGTDTQADTWYRFKAEITKLTASSASIDVNLVQLDAGGNPTGAPFSGSIADTSALASGHTPAAGYFTPSTMVPSYKNYTESAAPSDNTCFEVITGAPGPTILISGTPLSTFSSVPGSPSAEQSYSVSGSNLIADIVITAPTDFEVSSTSGSGFTSSLTLTQSEGTVTATPIYVRFNRAAAGTSNGDISHSSSGAATQNVPVSGTATAPGNYGLQFDGSTQYVTFGTLGRDNLGLSEFTLELWFKRTGAGTTVTSGTGGVVAVPLLTKGRGEGDGSNVDMNYFFGIRPTDNVLVADFEDMASGGNHPIAGVTAIPYAADAPWHHAAVTYDGNKWQLFLDGKMEAELTVGQTPRYDSLQYAALGAALNSCGQQTGGSRTGYTCPTVTDTGEFAGVLDEARIWNVARTQTEILSTINSELTSGSGLIGRWGMNEGSSTTITDSTDPAVNGTLTNGPLWVAGAPFNIVPPAQFNLTVNTSGNGHVTLSPAGGTYYDGTIVQLTAVADTGWIFTQWSGDKTGFANPTTISINDNKTVTATFLEGGTVSFQEGSSSYAGTVDTTIKSNTPSTSYGSQVYLEWDTQESSGTTPEIALLQFTDIFGSNAGQIPIGSTIVSATLRYRVYSNSGSNGSTSNVYEPLVSWDEATTYNTFGGDAGVQADEYNSTLVATATAAAINTDYTITVTASLQRWSFGTVNYGWVLLSNGTDGVEIHSSEAATANYRPLLTVSYTAPPSTPPAAPSGMTATTPQPNQVHLAWTDNANNEAGFELERSTTGIGGAYSLLITRPADTSTYDNINLTAGQEYCYQVRAINIAGQSAYSGPVCATPTSPEAFDFGSGSAYITFGDASALDLPQFTLETWFKREGTGTTSSTGSGGVTNAIPLVTKGRGEADDDNRDMNYFLGIRASDNVLVADFEEGGGGGDLGLNHPVIGVTPIVNNTWYHAAVTYDGNKWQVFLNGDLETELVVGMPVRWDSIQHAGLGTALNSTGVSEGHFDGVLDEARIWNYARTQTEIRSRINNQISAAETGLVARWALNDGGTTAAGSAGTTVNGTVTGSGYSWVTPGAPFDLTFNEAPNQPILIHPVDHATGVVLNPELRVQVSDPDGDPLDVSFYGREKSVAGEDFTIVVLPDTQFYSESYPATYSAQTQWIVDNVAALNIVYVAHEGDIVNVATNTGQWVNADAAMDLLDAADIPYGVVPGNHDEGSNYNLYFGVDRFCTSYPMGCKSFYGESYPAGDNQSSYTLFSASGMDFIFVNLDYTSPAAGLLSWADGVLAANSTRRAVVVSHDIIYTGNPGSFSSWGQSIYDALKDNPNLFMMMSGHTSGEGRRTDVYSGNTIYSLLADYQSRSNGGDGWLRLLEFSPSADKIYVKTFSPTRNGGAGEFETDADSQFELDYEMGGAAYTLIGTQTGVPSGSQAYVTWAGLLNSTDYEWYAVVSDGDDSTIGETWDFSTEAAANRPPAIAETDPQVVTMSEDGLPTPFLLTLHATDLDPGDTLTWSISGAASHGTANASGTGASKVIDYTPTAGYNGSDSFVVQVSDGNGGSDTITVNVTIQPVNDAPVITETDPQVVTMSEDGLPTPFSLTLHATDPDPGDTLTWSISGAASHGTASASGTGASKAIGYTPTANYNSSDSFVVQVSDGNGGSDTITVNVTIQAVNDAPAIAESDPQVVTMSEDGLPTPFSLTLHATDPDPGDTLTWSISGTASHGTASASGTGSSKAIGYTPTAGYSGSDSFVVQVSDGNGGSDTITVNVTIQPVNDASVISETDPQVVTMSEDGLPTPFSLTLHATDPDASDTLTWSISGAASHGTASASGTGASKAIGYTPTANYNGSDSFVVQVSDGNGGSDTITVNVTIQPVNDAPVITETDPQVVTMSEDGLPTPFSLTLHATDPDPGNTLTWSISAAASHGTASASGTGSSKAIGYTPTGDYNGSDSFVVQVSDGNGGSDTITVNVTIQAVNDAPIANDQAVTTAEDTPRSITLTGSDVDNVTFSYIIVSDPANGTLSGTPPNVTYTPDAHFSGSDHFTFKVNDGLLDSNEATVSITITANEYTLTTTSDHGTVTKNPNQATYHYIDVVQLTAAAETGWTFANWSGSLTGTDNPGSITIGGNETVTANYNRNEYTLTIISAHGTVTKSPNQATYHYGDVVQLSTVPDVGWFFVNWSGDLTGSANPADITIDGNKTVTANYTQTGYTLTVDLVGNGSVSKSPDQAIYHYGDVVTLSANPDPGWQFSGWSGDLSGSTNPEDLTIDGNKNVTATFTRIEYTLTVNVVGSGAVVKSPNQVTYHYGDIVQLTATADTGWNFNAWGGDLTGSTNPDSITIDGNKTVTATFTQIEYTITIIEVGHGTVIKNPNQTSYHYGDVVTLTAVPDFSNFFIDWTGDYSGTALTMNIPLYENMTITATFSDEMIFLPIVEN